MYQLGMQAAAEEIDVKLQSQMLPAQIIRVDGRVYKQPHSLRSRV